MPPLHRARNCLSCPAELVRLLGQSRPGGGDNWPCRAWYRMWTGCRSSPDASSTGNRISVNSLVSALRSHRPTSKYVFASPSPPYTPDIPPPPSRFRRKKRDPSRVTPKPRGTREKEKKEKDNGTGCTYSSPSRIAGRDEKAVSRECKVAPRD